MTNNEAITSWLVVVEHREHPRKRFVTLSGNSRPTVVNLHWLLSTSTMHVSRCTQPWSTDNARGCVSGVRWRAMQGTVSKTLPRRTWPSTEAGTRTPEAGFLPATSCPISCCCEKFATYYLPRVSCSSAVHGDAQPSPSAANKVRACRPERDVTQDDAENDAAVAIISTMIGTATDAAATMSRTIIGIATAAETASITIHIVGATIELQRL